MTDPRNDPGEERHVPLSAARRPALPEMRGIDPESLVERARRQGIEPETLERVATFLAGEIEREVSVPWWRWAPTIMGELTKLLYAIAAVRRAG